MACERISGGEARIVIGTHAVVQEKIAFHSLGLVVIDEQHRFGVLQRTALREKGLQPDILFMTATPIPRTLAMTVYGDLDVSVIDELPPQKKVSTRVVLERDRALVYEDVRRELARKNQAFIVYPLAEESEVLDLKDAVRMAEHLQKNIFPEYRIGLIHGRMKGVENHRIMKAFAAGQMNALVATTVIEVGIDIPGVSPNRYRACGKVRVVPTASVTWQGGRSKRYSMFMYPPCLRKPLRDLISAAAHYGRNE